MQARKPNSSRLHCGWVFALPSLLLAACGTSSSVPALLPAIPLPANISKTDLGHFLEQNSLIASSTDGTPVLQRSRHSQLALHLYRDFLDRRFSLIAQNIANATTTIDVTGKLNIPYCRQDIELLPDGSTRLIEDVGTPVLKYDPSHPFADARGFVRYPDIIMEVETSQATLISNEYRLTQWLLEQLK